MWITHDDKEKRLALECRKITVTMNFPMILSVNITDCEWLGRLEKNETLESIRREDMKEQ